MSVEVSAEQFVQRVKISVLGVTAIVALGILISIFIGIDAKQALINSTNTFLGVCGAIFANLSGAGGGVVFIPVFSYLNFSPDQMLASSFGIQCFGMTAGAITWYLHYRNNHRQSSQWAPLFPIIAITTPTSIAGIWTVYGGVASAPASLHDIFGIFSMLMGASLLALVLIIKPTNHQHNSLDMFDYPALILIGYFGGVVTAWLSVGVGEILVLYLIFRGFCTTMSVAAAVIVTVFTVWSAAIEHLILGDSVVWTVVLFAGPGAIVGGILARAIAGMISTKTLKVVLGAWIFFMGAVA